MYMEKKEFVIHSAAVCHKGMVRDKNQDNLFFNAEYLPLDHEGTEGILTYDFEAKEETWLGVFDGMGGEAEGELASYVAVSNFANMSKDVAAVQEELSRFYNHLNQIVCETAKVRKIGQMGTTASVACFDEENVCISNLGDSPIYLFHNKKMELVSELHNNAKLLKANNINRKPALTQFLGLDYEGMMLEPFVNIIPLVAQDMLLICSDGLTDMLSEDDIGEVLQKKNNVSEKVSELLSLTLEKGAVDNVTIILCEISKNKKPWGSIFKRNKGI